MNSFWAKEHPGQPIWSGVMIGWGETFTAAQREAA